MSHRQILWLFAAGQICFVLGLVICIAIKPAGLGANSGISYYGTFAETFAFYALAILGPAVCGLLAGWSIVDRDLWPVRFGLMFFALLAAIITFTPYTVGTLLDWTHTITGAILFSVQLLLSVWLVLKLRWDKWALVLGCLELLAGIVAAVYVLPSQGFLIQAQVAFQLSFGGLVIYSLNKLLERHTQELIE